MLLTSQATPLTTTAILFFSNRHTIVESYHRLDCLHIKTELHLKKQILLHHGKRKYNQWIMFFYMSVLIIISGLLYCMSPDTL